MADLLYGDMLKKLYDVLKAIHECDRDKALAGLNEVMAEMRDPSAGSSPSQPTG